MMDTIQFFIAHWQEIIVGIIAVFVGLIALMHAVIAIALVIPGPQPEAFLQKCVDVSQKVVDFLSKFSRKEKAQIK